MRQEAEVVDVAGGGRDGTEDLSGGGKAISLEASKEGGVLESGVVFDTSIVQESGVGPIDGAGKIEDGDRGTLSVTGNELEAIVLRDGSTDEVLNNSDTPVAGIVEVVEDGSGALADGIGVDGAATKREGSIKGSDCNQSKRLKFLKVR